MEYGSYPRSKSRSEIVWYVYVTLTTSEALRWPEYTRECLQHHELVHELHALLLDCIESLAR
jgi:hypothetical protein